MLTHVWGRRPAEPKPLSWGARAIYGQAKAYSIDLLSDRQGMSEGGTEAERKQLSAWLNKAGLPALRRLCRTMQLWTDSHHVAELDLDGWHIEASPQGSHGYLYIGVWPVGDAVPARVPRAKKASL